MPDNTPYYRAELSVSPSPPFLPVTHLTPQPPYTPFDSGSPSLKTRITTMENEIKLLKVKADDLVTKNRSRRSNIKIINVPERAEGNDTAAFVERLIPRLFGEGHFTSPVVIERAHRLGRPADRTRPIIAKFLNYRQREMVLRLAREKHPLLLDDNRISFYPDYSAETQRNMLAYNEVKKKLRDKNIEYASRYPAKLRVRHEGAFKLFSSPAEVENFLRTLED
ncbi:unnamed protein product [Knipowitschia caucasica]